MNCPHCGREIEVQQNRAAKSRWSGMTKAQRAAEMSRVRKLGVKRAKTKARPLRQNAEVSHGDRERNSDANQTHKQPCPKT